jgi:heterogeneous nuclear rnp K-like protein
MMAATTDRYDDDAIARLTGLTLDPETPPHLASSAHGEEEEDCGEHQEQATSATLDSEASGDDQGDESSTFTIRSLVTTKEAGVIIGKAGQNVAEIRDVTGVRAGVSKVIQGVHERVLTISGSVEGIAKAYSMIAKHLLDNPGTSPNNAFNNNNNSQASVRLLIPHQFMGAVIGKGGANIKEIQEASGAKMIIAKEMLSQSTERTVDVVGEIDAIKVAIEHIGDSMLKENHRITGVIYYDPRVRSGSGNMSSNYNKSHHHNNNNGHYQRYDQPYSRSNNNRSYNNNNGGYRKPSHHGYSRYNNNNNNNSYSRQQHQDEGNKESQTIGIPSDMVGCLIGKGGASINHIRRLSHCYISISKETNPSNNERDFTITGTPEGIEKALQLLYAQLEREQKRRKEMAEANENEADANNVENAADEQE